MKWRYKFAAQMDTNDADYVYTSGAIGTFDDGDLNQMKAVHMIMMYLNCYASKFDDGHANRDDVREAFEAKCQEYGLEEADYEDFDLDMYDYRPRDPNDDSHAHGLSFTFTRVPADVKEENVDEYCLRQYYNV